MKNNAQHPPVEYFTCTEVDEQDYPWNKRVDPAEDDDGENFEYKGDDLQPIDNGSIKDMTGTAEFDLDENTMKEFKRFPMNMFDTSREATLSSLPMSGGNVKNTSTNDRDSAEPTELNDDDGSFILVNDEPQAEDDTTVEAAHDLLSLNRSPPAAPASNHSGDTEVIDDSDFYAGFLEEARMEQQRLAEVRRGKRKAGQIDNDK